MNQDSPEYHEDRHGGVHVVWLKQGPSGSSRPFVKPRALQYFYKSTLYRTEGERSSGRFEIFLDLLFVGMAANLAHIVTEDPTGLNLLKYFLVGIPAWQMWGDIRDFMNYYYNDDLTQRCLVFWQMSLIVMFGNNAHLVGTSRKHTGLVIGLYIVSRLTIVGVLLIYTVWIPEHRKIMRSLCVFIITTSCIWFAAIWPPIRGQITLAIIAIAAEVAFFILNYSVPWRRFLKADYTTALNLDHEIERYEAFYVIVLGEFLYVIVFDSPAQIGFNLKFLRALFTLLIAYDLNWLYFNGDGSTKSTHALRRSKTTALIWLFIHIPLNACLILAADASGELTSNEFAEDEGEEESHRLKRAYSFIFCGGIGIGLLSIYIISLLTKSRDAPGQKWVSKQFRVVWRFPVAMVVVFLPFANLSSTLLMGIVALLLTLVVTFETLSAWDRVCEDVAGEVDNSTEIRDTRSDDHDKNVMREGPDDVFSDM